MTRDRRHFILNNLGKAQKFTAKNRGSSKHPSDVPDRESHAKDLLRSLSEYFISDKDGLPGVYLQIEGRPAELMITDSLNASGLTLLNARPTMGEQTALASVFASKRGIINLRKKINEFRAPPTVKEDGTLNKPKNADLVQSIGSIVRATLLTLWRSPFHRFPDAETAIHWEVWLDKYSASRFISGAPEYGVTIADDRLEFPEDLVVIAYATATELAGAIRNLTAVKALASPSTTAEDFDSLPTDQQIEWVADLSNRTSFAVRDPNYITLLDTGVSRAHPLLQPALAIDDCHAANPGWGIEDTRGHGTQIAGIALYGDLSVALQGTLPITIRHRLESAKVIPDIGVNPHHLLGVVTRNGVNAAESNGTRRRTFTLSSTTEDDTPHDGAPTSWSSEIDQLSSGASGAMRHQRLVVVSAGNSDQNRFHHLDYLSISDHADNEIESPSQAWNAICVGAYTEKTTLPQGISGTSYAPIGDLSPSSRTASWNSYWPLKPDVVMEGGNWVVDGFLPPMQHPALSILTTDHQYPLRAFTTTGDTSGATALAARAITEIWSEYPELWPETVRAVFIASARWTPKMRSHVPATPQRKGQFAKLFKRYGYGVPDLNRARRSASNALTLIVQDTIIPYKESESSGSPPVFNEMKVFNLPWPKEELRRLNDARVTLRVALSSFILPNPSEVARGSKFGYASHNLRFKLSRPDEKTDEFLARISKTDDETVKSPAEDDGWDFGRNRRDVGSLHIDQLACKASDLALRGLIAVHPVGGWWKSKLHLPEPESRSVRFALVVEIDAGTVDCDLYTEVQTAVKNLAVIATQV